MLILPDHWVWDSWLAVEGHRYHLFFLRASRALLDPRRRHLRAAIGHAVSADLRSWTLLPDALVHADGPAFDDTAIWTGCVTAGPDPAGGPHRWYLFYTGVTRADRAGTLPIQRIGLATSTDLISWQRYGEGPVVAADPRWYHCVEDRPGVSDAWRDPHVVRDPGGDGWHMLLTARARGGSVETGGVLGHARSDDLLHWEVLPPLTRPAGFRHLEVPQVHNINGDAVLIFSSEPAGTYTVGGGDLCDGWDAASAVPFSHPSLYAAQLVRDHRGALCLLGFRGRDGDGGSRAFRGEVLDPVPVAWVGGRLKAGT